MEGVGRLMDLSFYKGKKVFVTGHSGFKGAWMCKVLDMMGAEVIGYALPPSGDMDLYNIAKIGEKMISIIGDIRDLDKLEETVKLYQPEIVIHMAAQPLVRMSYENPVDTYETNVMGTVNICEAIRKCNSVKSFVNVTTDKVYRNNEWEWGYRETDALDGYDPYSNSKSCSELVTSSYKKSFFMRREIAISTCRAGNVIGGGDFSRDRIIPDCVRAVWSQKEILVRNPHSVRPYQHVLEPVCAYLMLAARQEEDLALGGNYNIGPDEEDCVETGMLVRLFCQTWGDGAKWKSAEEKNAPHESNYLKLDCSRIKSVLNWKPCWNIAEAVRKTVEWSKAYLAGEDINKVMQKQIKQYLEIE